MDMKGFTIRMQEVPFWRLFAFSMTMTGVMLAWPIFYWANSRNIPFHEIPIDHPAFRPVICMLQLTWLVLTPILIFLQFCWMKWDVQNLRWEATTDGLECWRGNLRTKWFAWTKVRSIRFHRWKGFLWGPFLGTVNMRVGPAIFHRYQFGLVSRKDYKKLRAFWAEHLEAAPSGIACDSTDTERLT